MIMIRFLFILLMFFGSANINAQKHMTFLNVSMDASITSFVQEMKKKGFRYIENLSPNMVHMKGGSFAGRENASLLISCTPKSKRVNVVMAWFNDYHSDEYINNAFNHFLFLYQRKYGEYERGIEDGTYVYKFDTGIGPVTLYKQPLSHGQMSGCFFRYSDPVNCIKAIKEMSDDI